jgi:hypothetical protein
MRVPKLLLVGNGANGQSVKMMNNRINQRIRRLADN